VKNSRLLFFGYNQFLQHHDIMLSFLLGGVFFEGFVLGQVALYISLSSGLLSGRWDGCVGSDAVMSYFLL
jgi:hypothetical protein